MNSSKWAKCQLQKVSKNLSNFFIINNNKVEIPHFPYSEMKDFVLGYQYKINLIFIDSKEIKELNLKYRNKDESTDILSFPLEKDCGEIYISIEDAKKEMTKFDRPLHNFIAFLFIHGLIHLKGYDHGSKMDKAEEEVRKQFGI
jgi:probable rRNA maturation factor